MGGNPNGWGCHPFSFRTRDTKLNHYHLQLSIYRRVLNTLYYPGRFTDELLLLNFIPAEPEAYYVYWMKPMDLDPLWNLYLPWRREAAVHRHFSLITPLVPYIPDTDPRCWAGPTYCTRIPEAADADPDEWNAVWTQKAVTSPNYPKLPASEFWSHPNRRWFGTTTPDIYASYEEHLLNSPALLHQLKTLAGKTLWCWCGGKDDRCNCEALVKWSNLLAADAFVLPPLPLSLPLVQEADSILMMPAIKDEAF